MNDLITRVHSDSLASDSDDRAELNAFHDKLDASILDDFDAIPLSGVSDVCDSADEQTLAEWLDTCSDCHEQSDSCTCDDEHGWENDGQPDEAQEWTDFNGGEEC